MPNVPIPAALRIELAAENLVVWEARRQNKSSPTFVELAGPGLPWMPRGIGSTIEEAVADALRNPHFQRLRPGLTGAMARLDGALDLLRTTLWMEREKVTGVRELDDDIPF